MIINNNKKYPISIFGSCVSRDLLEFFPERYDLKTYIARQTMLSAVSPPVSVEGENFIFKSEFQRKRVLWDLEKTTFSLLDKDESKYLLIDLIDERFRIARFQNSYVTLSNELVNSYYFKDNANLFVPVALHKRKNWGFSRKILQNCYYIENQNITRYINRFIEKILSIYRPENIIIHCAYLCDYYIDISGQKRQFSANQLGYNHRINAYLKDLYMYLLYKIPQSHKIDISDSYCAYEKHKWGLAPMHYCDEYYQHANRLINEVFYKLNDLDYR